MDNRLKEVLAFFGFLFLFVFIPQVGATPQWLHNSTSIPSVYNYTVLSIFNITWNDTLGLNISTVLFESNFSGSPQNYTMTLIDPYINATENKGVYNFNLTLPAGTFYWKVYANASDGSWNSTPKFYFTISKATPSLSITGTGTFTYPYTSTVQGTETNEGDSGVTYTLYRNGTPVSNPETIELPAGVYLYEFNVSESQNYTSGSVTALLTINKGVLSGSISGSDVTYPSPLSLSSSENNPGDSDVIYNIYCDNILISSSTGSGPSGSYQLGAGTYTCKLNTTSGPFANWTANSSIATIVLTVNKGILSLSITPDQTKTYPATITITASEDNVGDDGVIYQLWRNDTLLPSLSETIELAAGVYVYRFNATGNANWTANSTGVISIVTINKGNNTNLSISCSPSLTVTYPTAITCIGYEFNIHGGTDISYCLWRNESLIDCVTDGNVSEYILLGAGTYVYKFNSSEGKNWTANSTGVTLILTVNQNQTNPLSLSINGQTKNVTVYYGDSVEIVGNALYDNSGTLFLYRNGTEVKNGTKTISYTFVPDLGTYTFLLNISGNQNYTSNFTGLIYYLFVKLRPDGYVCSASNQCLGGYCVHGICRSSAWYPGDGYCDSELGETYLNSPDCPSPVSVALPRVLVNLNITPGRVIGFINFIPARGKATINIEKTTVGVSQIEIEVKNRVTSVSITITRLKEKPLQVPKPAEKVYHYLNIIKSNLLDKDISRVRIRFQVEKTWVEDNDIDPSKVYLLRFSDDQWTKLSTTKVGEDETYIYYEAESPGLSYFAIVGEKVAAPPPSCPTCPPPTPWSECVEGKQTRTNYRCGPETNYTCESYTEERECEVVEEAPAVPTWLTGVVVVLIAAFLLLLSLKKMGKKRR